MLDSVSFSINKWSIWLKVIPPGKVYVRMWILVWRKQQSSSPIFYVVTKYNLLAIQEQSIKYWLKTLKILSVIASSSFWSIIQTSSNLVSTRRAPIFSLIGQISVESGISITFDTFPHCCKFCEFEGPIPHCLIISFPGPPRHTFTSQPIQLNRAPILNRF